MKSLILIALALIAVIGLDAQTRRKRNQAGLSNNQTIFAKCGVHFKAEERTIDDVLSYGSWTIVGSNPKLDIIYYYDEERTSCGDDGILRTWIKRGAIKVQSSESFTLFRYELKCRSDQRRIITAIDYGETGKVLRSTKKKNAEWEDVVPDTFDEAILRKACHKAETKLL